jgi:hypothetical protein
MERGAYSLLLNQRKNQLGTIVTNAAEALRQASWSISKKGGHLYAEIRNASMNHYCCDVSREMVDAVATPNGGHPALPRILLIIDLGIEPSLLNHRYHCIQLSSILLKLSHRTQQIKNHHVY